MLDLTKKIIGTKEEILKKFITREGYDYKNYLSKRLLILEYDDYDDPLICLDYTYSKDGYHKEYRKRKVLLGYQNLKEQIEEIDTQYLFGEKIWIFPQEKSYIIYVDTYDDVIIKTDADVQLITH